MNGNRKSKREDKIVDVERITWLTTEQKIKYYVKLESG